MAKYRFKPTPAGILFLSAIAVLVIALITVVIVLAVNCKSEGTKPVAVVTPAPPTEEPSIAPITTPEPVESVDPSLNPLDPDATPNPDDPTGTSTDGPVVVNTPGSATASASATAGTSYPSEPTSDMKNNAQKGHVTADDVNMRKGPSKDYASIKKVSKNTNVTLYKEYSGWWFLKCGSDYGYIKSDYVAKGEASGTTTGDVAGTVNASTVALRKGAAKSYECIKEYSKGEAVTIHYKSADGEWYYVTVKSDGKKGWMSASLVKANGKVGTKSN